MNITVEKVAGKTPVTIMGLQGELDGSNYLDVINKAKELYGADTRNLLIDMSDMSFMASSGIVALHSIALVMRGEEPPDPEYGWDAFHSLDRDRGAGVQQHVKLLSPQPSVDRTLTMTGLKDQFFEVHTDRERAIASF